MTELIHPGINNIRMGNRNLSSKPVIHWLIVLVIIAIIIMVSVLANLQSAANKKRLPSAGTQVIVPGTNLLPTPSQSISRSGRVLLPFVYKFGFDPQRRPYTADSYWNTPIDNNPEYDPHSTEMIATVSLDGGGSITSDPTQYTYPVYYADANTPRWDVPCTRYRCTVITPQDTYTVDVLKNVPIPDLAQPSPGTDGQMIIIDKNTFTEYDLWQVVRTNDGWSVSNGTIYNITWESTPPWYGSRGAGVPYLVGLIRPWEIQQGRIEHAIAFGYPETALDRCVFPATRTDGESTLPYAIPEGAHLQLDPTLTDADFNNMGLSRTGKIIARALQDYGMILIDTAGRAKIYAEELEVNPYAQVDWTDPGLNLTPKTIAGIPYTYFRVLKLPEAYWNQQLGEPTYRDCYDDTNH